MRVTLVAVVLASSACVNNYVVRPDASEDEGDDGDTTCATDTCGAGDEAAEGEPFACMPCESDSDCGDQWDNCVMLDVIGAHCLVACPEAGCGPGYNCRVTLSVDQVQAMQCAPQISMCTGD